MNKTLASDIQILKGEDQKFCQCSADRNLAKLDSLTKQETRQMARIEFLCSSEKLAVIKPGKNNFLVYAGIPKYFLVRLKGKAPPGTISFAKVAPGTSMIAYVSYSNR
jgi:hypothetical protein